MQRRYHLLFLLLLGASLLSAQNIRFNLHNAAPLWLNAANTGIHADQIRLSTLYQGWFWDHSRVQTPQLSVDLPVRVGFRSSDWLGVGLHSVYQHAQNEYVTTQRRVVGLSTAYHLSLGQHLFSAGWQLNHVNLTLASNEVCIPQNTIAPEIGGFSRNDCAPFAANKNLGSTNHFELDFSLAYRYQFGPEADNTFSVGLAYAGGHSDNPVVQNAPNDSLATGRNARSFSPHLRTYANLDVNLGTQWRFQPTVFFQRLDYENILSAQTWLGRRLKANSLLKLGFGYRSSKTGSVLAGFSNQHLTISAAYDIRLSNHQFDAGQLIAFELAASYLFGFSGK